MIDGLRVVQNGLNRRRARRRQRPAAGAARCRGEREGRDHGRCAMKFSSFFITRPIFAIVLSLLIVVAGALALLQLPISEYPGVVPPTVVVPRRVPRRQSESDRRDRRLAARAADERRRGHALHVLAGDVGRRADADHHLRARHRSRQRAGAGAEPRRPDAAAPAAGRAAHRRHHREGLARLHHGRAPGLARRALRHALPVELRAPAGEGRALAAGRRRRRPGVRRRRIQHARVAGSRTAWRHGS